MRGRFNVSVGDGIFICGRHAVPVQVRAAEIRARRKHGQNARAVSAAVFLDLARQCCQGWSGVVDRNGSPVKFDRDKFSTLLGESASIRRALAAACGGGSFLPISQYGQLRRSGSPAKHDFKKPENSPVRLKNAAEIQRERTAAAWDEVIKAQNERLRRGLPI